jgi:hypothetical protein
MRASPIYAFVLFCACAPSPDAREKTSDRPRSKAESNVAGAGQNGSSLMPAWVGSSASDTSTDGAAELRRLTAARRQILIDHLDADSASASEFTTDPANNPSAYAGEYHFGDSEWESTLTLTVHGDAVSGRLGYADWEHETWVGKEVRLDGGRIADATLVAPGWKAVFVLWNGQPGIVILRAPTRQLGIQYGERLYESDQ